MTYSVQIDGVTVGLVDFAAFDDGMGVALGPFRPTREYSRIEPVFRKYHDAVPSPRSSTPGREDAVNEFFRERDALGLILLRPDGGVVPTTWIMIYDFTAEAGADGLECEVRLAEGLKSLA